MAPRGLSAEEKRVKLLEIFHETKDFYQLKELEKLGPKMKGIGDYPEFYYYHFYPADSSFFSGSPLRDEFSIPFFFLSF